MGKQWKLVDRVNEDLRDHLLAVRGVTEPEAREAFLNPVYLRDLHDPFALKGMREAVLRLSQAVEQGEKVVIFGDYDADGVPGTAILYLFLKQIGHEALDIYIPDRHNEAYGLNVLALEKLAAEGAKLIVTVDCGIANASEVARATELGLEVIVTDHHLAPETLPAAVAIIDSKQPGDDYPYSELAGAGVAFKLVQGLIKFGQQEPESRLGQGVASLPESFEKWLLDLVAIATVSDMVPLTGENRALAYFGLKVLRQTRRPGLRVLYNLLDLRAPFVTEDDIGFSIAPRLNSASRMSHAREAFALLTTADADEAEKIANHLETKNRERRTAVEVITKHIEDRYNEEEEHTLIVCGEPTWSLGVLGLAAARMVERYRCPVFLWGQNEAGEIKGSCRSDGTVNVVELMAASGTDFFINYGGHVMAGGFAVTTERQTELERRLREALVTVARDAATNEIVVDATLEPDEVTEETWQAIEQLAPFGVGNPKPVFLMRWVIPRTIRTFGSRNNHLEVAIESTKGVVKAISFFTSADSYPEVNLTPGCPVDMLVTMEKSYYRGRAELRLRIVDIQKAAF